MPLLNKVALIAAVTLGTSAEVWARGAPVPVRPPATAAPVSTSDKPALAPLAAQVAEPSSMVPPVRAARYDNVGYAVWSDRAGTVSGAHTTLAPGSFVEVTALDTGRTILVPITATSRPGYEIELSGAAARELGFAPGATRAGVRVRTVNPTGGDLGALRAGQPAPPRPDSPPVLLNALRHKLAGTQGKVDTPATVPADPATPARAVRSTPGSTPKAAPVREAARPVPAKVTPTPRPAAATPIVSGPASARSAPAALQGPRYYVQIATFADPQRAQATASKVHGKISAEGKLHRVRTGPFDDQAAAKAARDDVARRGYADARIVRVK